MIAVLMLVALGMPPEPVADDLPSPTELFKLYRKNFDGMHTLKLQWKRDHKYTEAWSQIQAKTLESLASEIARLPADGSDDSHAKRQEMVRQRQMMAVNLVTKTLFQTYLTDRTRFMMRNAPPNWAVTHTDDDWLMPDVPVTPETMTSRYAGYTLLSYSGDPARGLRSWTPQAYTGGAGQIQAVNVPGLTNHLFPPLGADRKEWGGTLHAIDQFFQDDSKTYRTIGRATIDGHETVIVESRTENMSLRSFLTEADAKVNGPHVSQFEVVRAYLDPKRGGLPVKIEWDGESFYDGKPLPRPKSSRPQRVLEVSEILELKGGGFYPARGVDRTYGPDPNWTGPANTFPGLLAGKVLEFPTVPYEETSWKAASVVANEPLTESFAMKFPDGTYYYNGMTNTNEQSGWEDRSPIRLPWALSGVIVAGWLVYGLVALARTLHRRSRGHRLEPGGTIP
ncbi:MAG: resA 6 [Planctomycetota bacterium]|nr:resA 6 [Planctomycetota bacterium]